MFSTPLRLFMELLSVFLRKIANLGMYKKQDSDTFSEILILIPFSSHPFDNHEVIDYKYLVI